MQANVIIRMGAANYDCRVRGADGQLVRFDLRAMDKEGRRNFHREFMNTYRAATKPLKGRGNYEDRHTPATKGRRVSKRNTKGMQ